MNINRSNIHKLFLAVSLALESIGFSDSFGPIASGLGRGLGAVFFCLFMICNYLKNQKTDEELRGQAAQEHCPNEADRNFAELQSAQA